MVIKRLNSSKFIIGTSDRAKLDVMQQVMDGSKVRMKNQIIVPINSLSKFQRLAGSVKVDYQDDSLEVINHLKNMVITRIENTKKIKQAYKDNDVKFDYDYKGVYDTIMNHQKVMYNMMAYNNACAILSDPGTGKTGPLLWAIDKKMEQGRVKKCLFITLSGLKDNVLDEAITELPNRKIVVLNSKAQADKILNKKFKVKKKNEDYDIYISNYESMNSLVDLFDDDYFDMIILDEAHRVGSPSSNQTKAIISKFETAKYKYISSGTLNANNLMSFYMPFRFLGADTIPIAKYYAFRKHYMSTVDPDERIWVPKMGAKTSVAQIIGRISVLFKKEDCMDLPGITRTKIGCDMAGDQKKAYNKAKKDMIVQIDEFCNECPMSEDCDRSSDSCTNEAAFISNALVLARKLHQMASGFYIDSYVEVDAKGNEKKVQNIIEFNSNPKLKLLIDTISNIPDDKKVIIWATYTHSVEMIAKALKKKFGNCVITGYGSADGFQVVQDFKKDKNRLLVANTTKMGTGHNIQFSNYQVFFDNSFSYIVRNQAECRQYRKGQDSKVTVYDCITRETIDEHVIRTLEDKEGLSLRLSQFAKVIQ